MPVEHGRRLRPLQRDQRALGQDREATTSRHRAGVPKVGDVRVLAGRVDHEDQPVLGAGRDQVVEDAALVVGELGVAHGRRLEAGDVPRHEALERGDGTRAVEPELAHVGDVEEPGGAARARMLRHDARFVAHRHGVAGEADQGGAERAVLVVERGPGEVGGALFAHGVSQARTDSGQRSRAGSSGAPSVSVPERLSGRPLACRRLTPSVRRRGVRRLLSRVASPRGPCCLRVSGTLAPSAPRGQAARALPRGSPARPGAAILLTQPRRSTAAARQTPTSPLSPDSFISLKAPGARSARLATRFARGAVAPFGPLRGPAQFSLSSPAGRRGPG